jgi:hypothetical protein
MKTRKEKPRELTVAELEAVSRDFDRLDFSPGFRKAPAGEQSRHDRAIRQALRKRGRPPVGGGAERIQITVERTLLAQADELAKCERISRSELIARGLRLALAS